MAAGLIESPEDLYRYLIDSKTRLLSNIIFAGSPGHQIQELDYFLRKYVTGDISRDNRYLWIQTPGEVTEAIAEVYGPHFRQYNLGMIARDDLFDMAVKILQMVPELGVDVGVSHYKYSISNREKTFLTQMSGKLYYATTNDYLLQTFQDYYRLRDETPDFDPWTPARPPIEGPFADFLGGDLDRIACIHMRARSGNGGVPVPPDHFFPSLEYLRDSGFKLVKCGTEPYPKEFLKYEVLNYSESPHRSFKNDVALLGHSKLCIIAASGLENLIELMDIPIVSYARWAPALLSYSKNTVTVPALLFDSERQRILTFGEQILFFKTRHELWEDAFFGWHPPINRFRIVVPQPDELLAAVHETLALRETPKPLSELQNRFKKLDENGLWSRMKCRISNQFLEQHQHLL